MADRCRAFAAEQLAGTITPEALKVDSSAGRRLSGVVTVAGRPVEVAIIGGGLLGLATAYRLLEARPRLRVSVLERESRLAAHQSGHNSGVVHAGVYYAPGSMKARLCREGKAQLEVFCAAHGIPLDRIGKLIVALEPDELPGLDRLLERATRNGVPDLEVLDATRIPEVEPHVVGLRAIWSPSTGIVDFGLVAGALATEIRSRGAEIRTSWPVRRIDRVRGELVLHSPAGELRATAVIGCAGLWADRVAAMTEPDERGGPRIVPFRGDYYAFTPEARSLVRGLVYPVPDPRFPFLGVHLTKRPDGEVWAGPNAVLAFARDGYRRRDLNVRDLASTLAYRGFQRLALRNLRTGAAEMWRDWVKAAFVDDVRRFLPELRGDQLTFGPSGVRAQAIAADGTLVDDFDFSGSGPVLHVRNAPSPAATACLAIGAEIATRAIVQFELGPA
jgi:L-2-hydroxyglutarate oxidase